ncbi:ATP synthase subunit I [Baaleninema sp.]|uniref:ATP synthase subunit I n=1 Tax=Baaleninema sp. TaxID=3101197 RepID=UPI003D031AB5
MQPRFQEDIPPLTTLPRFRRSDTEVSSVSPRSIPKRVERETPTSEPASTPASTESVDPNADYHRLKLRLFALTLVLAGIVFTSAWLAYSRDVALNYLLGASVGLVYLRMMARDVERLGNVKAKLGNGRLGLFVGLIVVASQLDSLQILPVFLGFLTYKVAIVTYVLFATFAPDVKS